MDYVVRSHLVGASCTQRLSDWANYDGAAASFRVSLVSSSINDCQRVDCGEACLALSVIVHIVLTRVRVDDRVLVFDPVVR